MRITTVLTAIFISILALSATDTIAKDEIYRWVDENGVVHFSDRSYGNPNAERIDIRTRHGVRPQASSAPVSTDTNPQVSYAQQQRAERSLKREEVAAKEQTLAAGCAQRRQLVNKLEPSTRVMVTHKDGSVTRMDDNDRLKALGEAKAYIAENCNK